MDIRAAASAFLLVFLAELGDKTQLTTLSLAARSGAATAVFLGSALALVLSSLLGVLLGGTLGRVLPEVYIHWGAGLAFLLFGILLLYGRL